MVTPTTPPTLDVIAPISLAIRRVKTVLFAPFDLSKWLAVGFCAWLAWLGEGWSGANFNLPSRHRVQRGDLEGLGHFLRENLTWLVPLAVFVGLFGLAVWLLFTWLSSRGRFMFLNSVARNSSEIANPWRNYSRQGDSVFLFRILFGIISLVLFAPIVVTLVVSVLTMARGGRGDGAALLLLLCAVCLLAALILLFLIIGKFLTDFVVPIMMLRRVNVLAGWREFSALVRAHPGAFLLYLLFQIVIQMVLGVLVLLVVVGTCCLAGCLLVLPYIGTVFLLPILVFERAYSAHYLAQLGPDFDVFAAPVSPPGLPSGAPTLGPTI